MMTGIVKNEREARICENNLPPRIRAILETRKTVEALTRTVRNLNENIEYPNNFPQINSTIIDNGG